MSTRFIRRQVPLILTFLVGMTLTADWFIKWEPIQSWAQNFLSFHIIISAFMIGFAAVNLTVIHTGRIKRGLSDNKLFDTGVSVVLLSCLTIWTVVGLVFGSNSPTYQWLYDNFNLPCSATAYAATAFYVASGAYRVLRIRSTETGLLLVVAILTFMANTPFLVSIIPPLMTFRVWTEGVLVKSTYRAITIGVGLGAMMMGLRTLLGMETGYLGVTEE